MRTAPAIVVRWLTERVPQQPGAQWHSRLSVGLSLIVLVVLALLTIIEAVFRGPADVRTILVFASMAPQLGTLTLTRMSGLWKWGAAISLLQILALTVFLDLYSPFGEAALACAVMVWAVLVPVVVDRRATWPAFAVSAVAHVVGWPNLMNLHSNEAVSLAGVLLTGAGLSAAVNALEGARERAQQHALERAKAAEMAAAEALRSAEAKSTFLATMSHEIRTPMNGVLGMAHLLQASQLTADQTKLVGTLQDCGQSLLHVLNDVLDFSKMEAGQLHVEHIAWSPSDVVRRVYDLLSSVAAERGLSFSTSVDDDVPDWVNGDPTRVRQVLLNLVGNALKFTSVGQVHVGVRRSADRLHIEVRDTGVGIPPDAQAQLFEAFTQADGSTTRRYGGTGLGLAISRRLCSLMDGTLELVSELGEGSTFTATLPLSVACAPTPDVPATCDVARLKDMHVLVAEDNAVNRMLIDRMLKNLGVRVTMLNDGTQVTRVLAQQSIDLVLMDLQMPGMDGFETTANVRRMTSPLGDVPIVALTASALVQDRQRCLDAGMDDHITKPIDPKLLERTLIHWSRPRGIKVAQ